MFIVEEGQFNQGSLQKAKQFIEIVSLVGADGIEFQMAYADGFYTPDHPMYKHYKKIEHSEQNWEELIALTKSYNLKFIATPLDFKSIEIAEKNKVHVININASDFNNFLHIRQVIETGIDFSVTSLFSNDSEINKTVEFIRSQTDRNFTLLVGQHTMGTKESGVEMENTNLGMLKRLAEELNLTIGYVDHTNTIYTPGIAVAAGAKVVTKHMTINRLFKGPDNGICLNPEEMKKSIEIFKKTKKSIAETYKKELNEEDFDRKNMTKSLYFSRDLKKGSVVQIQDLISLRPYVEDGSVDYTSLIGKVLNTETKINQPVTNKLFE